MTRKLPHHAPMDWHRALAFACFFASGFAALVYEICWIRQSSLVFGSTTRALSTVLAVFFLGFAIGSHVLGSRAARVTRPLLWLAGLELLLAVTGVASLAALGLAERWYGAVYRATGGDGSLLVVAQVVGTAMVMLIPTIAMGGTLPMMCEQLMRTSPGVARTTGLLYGLNTLGAAAGCFTAGMFLIPTLGVQRSIMIAAMLNLMVATGFSLLARSAARGPQPSRTSSTPADDVPRIARNTVYGLVFNIGMTALGYEVLWTRFLALVIRTSVYTYTTTLTIVLVGIASGSWLASLWIDRSAHRAFWFGLVQVALGLVVLVTLLLPPAYWGNLHDDTLWICGLLLAPAAILSGMSFPLAVRMVTGDVRLAGRNVGRLAAVNTLGGIVGSLAMGFVALPLWGLQTSLLISTAICLAGGCAAWLLLERPQPAWPRLAMVAVGAGAWLVIPIGLKTRLPVDFLATEPSQLVSFREGIASNVAVVQKQDSKRLEIDRWWQGEEGKGHQIMAAHLPMLIRPEAKRVLVVGGGLGQTASRFLMYDIQKMDCVEIEPAVFDLVRNHFDARWMEDPRVSLLIEDGRNYITHTDTEYDIISLELGQVSRPGVASFYTADFYRRARARLAPGGLVCQFVPVPFFRPEEFRSALRTFQEVFPECCLWYNTSELLLTGSLEPIRFDREQMTAAWAAEAVQRDLEFSHWGGPNQWVLRRPLLLSCLLAGPAEIKELARGAEVFCDDRPILEFRTSQVQATELNEMAAVEVLREHLADIDTAFTDELSDEELSEIQDLRRQHLGDMVASGLIRRVEMLESAGAYAEIAAVLTEALRWNPVSVRANRLMGEALLKLGKPEDARRYLEQAVAVDAKDALAHRALGVALHRLGEPAAAMEHYRQAAAHRPDDPELINNLGVALAQSGQMDEAVEHFRQALDLRPGYADARRNLAQALQAQSPAKAPQRSGALE